MLALLSGLAVVQQAGPVSRAQAPPERPNILLFVTDDQRESLSVMPNVRLHFRREGTNYSPAFVTTPVCCPSRASIMTGRYAHNHGVKRNSNPEEPGYEALDQSTTVQAYLHADGYRTAVFGKTLNSWPVEQNPPHFDKWSIVEAGVAHYFDPVMNVNGTIKQVTGYSTTILRRRALSFLRSNTGEQPWFLFVATEAPHSPYKPEPRYAEAQLPRWEGNPAVFEEDKSDKPPYVQGTRNSLWQGIRLARLQQRTLLSVDDMVGEIFEQLEASGEADNTLAFFISDNGHMWKEHGLTGKGVPYEQAVQVPFLARWPGHIGAGVKDKRWAANIDIAPTILEAAGIQPTLPVDGRSLLQPWRRERILLEAWCNAVNTPCNRWAATWSRPPADAEEPEIDGEPIDGASEPEDDAAATEPFEYVEYYENGETSFREYYDLAEDPWQLTNLLGDRDPITAELNATNDPADVAELHSQLDADRMCSGGACP